MSKIGAGNLDSRIQILKWRLVDTGLSEKIVHDPDKTVWAKATYVSDGEKFRSGALGVAVSIRFIVRKISLDHRDKIKYQGVDYDVVSIKPYQDSKSLIEITVGGNGK